MPYDRVILQPHRYLLTKVLNQQSSVSRVNPGMTPPANWTWQTYVAGDAEMPGIPQWIFEHKPTGLRVTGSGPILDRVDCNLPKLLRGSYGYVLANDAEIYAAETRLAKILDEISHPSGPDTWIPKSLELGWQFPLPVADFIAAWRLGRHPYVRSAATITEGREIVFQGREFMLKAYNKHRMVGGLPNPTTRVEILLKRRKLRELVGSAPVQHLDFTAGWNTLRNAVLLLDSERIGLMPSRPSITDLLAYGELYGWRAANRSMFELWAQGRDRSHVSTTRTAVSRRVRELATLDLRSCFPPEPPPAVQPPLPLDCAITTSQSSGVATAAA